MKLNICNTLWATTKINIQRECTCLSINTRKNGNEQAKHTTLGVPKRTQLTQRKENEINNGTWWTKEIKEKRDR